MVYNENTKIAVVCNTPWQILGAINIVVNNVEGSSGKSDLFVINDFSGAEKICEQLKKEKIFNSVVFCSALGRKRPTKIKTLKRLLFPRKVFREYGINDRSIVKKQYRKIFIGDGNLLGRAIKSINRNVLVFLYDDGVDTYIGNSLTDGANRLYRRMGKILHWGEYSYRICKMYVNCKDFCISEVTKNVGELPKLDTKNKAVQIAKKVFCFSEQSMLLSHRFILLGQPLGERKGYNGKPFGILYPDQNRDMFLVRKHPRQEVIDNGLVTYDKVNNMWELECIFNINNEHVLIAYYSTAQITAKLIAGKEPYVIFVYKLFLDKGDEKEMEKYETIIRSFIDLYKKKDKVFVPSNEKEYSDIIQKLMKGN